MDALQVCEGCRWSCVSLPHSDNDTVKSPSFSPKKVRGSVTDWIPVSGRQPSSPEASGQNAHSTGGCGERYPENSWQVDDLVPPSKRGRRNFSQEMDQLNEIQGSWQDPDVNEPCVKTV